MTDRNTTIELNIGQRAVKRQRRNILTRSTTASLTEAHPGRECPLRFGTGQLECRFGGLDAVVDLDRRWFRGLEDRLGRRDLCCRTLGHHEEPIHLHGGLVVDHAVLRYADAIERCAERAQPADQNGVLEGDDGNGQEQASEEQAPEATPERTAAAPELDAVAGTVEADDFLFRVVALADNAQKLHREAGRGQLHHGRLGGRVVRKDADDGFGLFHVILVQSEAAAGIWGPGRALQARRHGERPSSAEISASGRSLSWWWSSSR